jgi:ribosomal protein L30/L7E
MLAAQTRGVPRRGCSKEKRNGYGETENNAALARSLDGERRCRNRLFYSMVGVRLRGPGLARNQARQILPVIGLHSRSTGRGKEDAAGLRPVVDKIALLTPFGPK